MNMGRLEYVTAVFHWLFMLQVVVQVDGGGRLEESDVSCLAVPVVPCGAMSVSLPGWRWVQHTLLTRHYLGNIYRMLLVVPVIWWPVRNSNIQRSPPMKSREISWPTYGLSHCQNKWDMTQVAISTSRVPSRCLPRSMQSLTEDEKSLYI